MTNGKYTEAVTRAYQNLQKSTKAVAEVLAKLNQFPKDQQETIKTQGKAVREKLRALSLRISPPGDRSGIFEETELEPQLTGLGSRLETSLDAPTTGQLAEFKRLEAKTKETISQINQFYAGEYSQFVTLVKEAGLSLFPKIEPISIEE